MIDFKGAPFHLNEEGIAWVQDTLAGMTLEEKVGQLFCPMGFNDSLEALQHMICDLGVGGMMYRPETAENIQNTYRTIQNMTKIPMLLAANTECGGDGLMFEGTSFGQPMAAAATGDVEDAYRMGYVACKEGAAVGMNWGFAPIVDIDMDFHNPITNTRTFGSDVERVIACGSRYLDAAAECNVATSIKHFPGDGSDERDQHILTSINNLSCEEWDATYGRVYSALIAKGSKTVMVGHIAQPAYVAHFNPDATNEEKLRPASLSKEIVTDLLRKKLGFEGLIITDSTPMVGFCVAMPRKDAIPAAIAAGCDMILFNKGLDQDYQYLMGGVRSGVVTEERLDDAVTRILAVKASLHLHEKQKAGTLVPEKEALSIIGCQEHIDWANAVADKSVTLVKDTQNLLPISPKKFRRVYLNVIQKDPNPEDAVVQRWKSLFEEEGFEVTVRDRRVTITPADLAHQETMSDEKKRLMYEMFRSIEEVKQDYDLYVYIANMENASNNTTLRLNWNVAFGLGDDAPWLVSEVPVMMISTAYPYHMFDAPMIKTFINSYSARPHFCRAVMDKIMGRSEFKGQSPVDPFCGKDYLRMTAE